MLSDWMIVTQFTTQPPVQALCQAVQSPSITVQSAFRPEGEVLEIPGWFREGSGKVSRCRGEDAFYWRPARGLVQHTLNWLSPISNEQINKYVVSYHDSVVLWSPAVINVFHVPDGWMHLHCIVDVVVLVKVAIFLQKNLQLLSYLLISKCWLRTPNAKFRHFNVYKVTFWTIGWSRSFSWDRTVVIPTEENLPVSESLIKVWRSSSISSVSAVTADVWS